MATPTQDIFYTPAGTTGYFGMQAPVTATRGLRFNAPANSQYLVLLLAAFLDI